MNESPMEFQPLPIHPPRTVAAKRGWSWLLDGFTYFKKAPLMWIGVFVVMALTVIVISVIPVVGPIAGGLLQPVWGAGLMVCCHVLQREERLEIKHLFTGFGPALKPLIMAWLVLIVIEVIALLVLFGSPMFSVLAGGDPSTFEAEAQANPLSLLVRAVLLLGVLAPVIAAAFYTPALIILSNQSPMDALKLSLRGCFRNIWPMLVWGLASTVLVVIASIPFALGFLIVVPMLAASTYLSYRDIFVD